MNYLVITFDNDDQQEYVDIIHAESSDAALEFVMTNRPYVNGGCVFDSAELRSYAYALDTTLRTNADNGSILELNQGNL